MPESRNGAASGEAEFVPVAVDPQGPVVVGGTTLRRDVTSRFASDAFTLVASLVTATLTARVLGPAGKGYFASLTLLVSFLVAGCEAGIGEATIVLVGRGSYSLRRAAPALITAMLTLAVLGGGGFIVLGTAIFSPSARPDRIAFLVAVPLVVMNICYTTGVSLLLSLQRVASVARISAVGAAASVVGMWVLLVGLHLHAEGAVTAVLAGVSLSLLMLLRRLRAASIPLRPGRSKGFLREAFRLGMSFQISNLLIMAAARFDLLIVFQLKGAATAGRYSVALTIGLLVSIMPIALCYAAFPRLPGLPEEDARVLIARIVRLGLAAALTTAASLAILAPFGVPLMFGSAFTAAVGPTLILLGAGVLWGGQWIVCRSAAARGGQRALLTSFLASFIVMVVLDLVLIPPYANEGAALAALLASGAGAAIAAGFHRAGGGRISLLLPRPEDFVALARFPRRMFLQ